LIGKVVLYIVFEIVLMLRVTNPVREQLPNGFCANASTDVRNRNTIVSGSAVTASTTAKVENIAGTYEADFNLIPSSKFLNFFDDVYKQIRKKKVVYTIFVEKGNQSEYNTWLQKKNNLQATNGYTKRIYVSSKVVENALGNAVEIDNLCLVENLSTPNQSVTKLNSVLGNLKEELLLDDNLNLAKNYGLYLIEQNPQQFLWGMYSVGDIDPDPKYTLLGVKSLDFPKLRNCYFSYNKSCFTESVNDAFSVLVFVPVVFVPFGNVAVISSELIIFGSQAIWGIQSNQMDQVETGLSMMSLSAALRLAIKPIGMLIKHTTTQILIKAPTKVQNYYIAYQFQNSVSQAIRQGITSHLNDVSPNIIRYFVKNQVQSNTEKTLYFVFNPSTNRLSACQIKLVNNVEVFEVIGSKEGVVVDIENASAQEVDDLVMGLQGAGDDFLNGLLDANKYIQEGKFIPNVKKIDLMGGRTSQLGGEFANIDLQATKGINGDVSKLSQYIQPNSIDEIIVSNPFPTAPFAGPKEFFLTEASKVMKPGTTLTVNGTISNKFFKNVKVGNIEDLGFEIVEFQVPLKSQFQNMKFYQVDGVTQIPNSNILTTIIRKK
jgi:hypothetical protein